MGHTITKTHIAQTENAPPTHRIFGHLPAFRKDPLGFLTHCARSSPNGVVPLQMLNRPVLLLSSPSDIERVLVTEHQNFIKPAWLRTPAVSRLLGEGLVTSEGADWKRQHHACQPAFQLRRMDSYGDQIAVIAQRTLTRWAPGQIHDLQQTMAHLTLEIVAATLFDLPDTDWIPTASAAMDILMARFTASHSLFGRIPWPPSPREIRATRQLNAVADLLIHRHTRHDPRITDHNLLSMDHESRVTIHGSRITVPDPRPSLLSRLRRLAEEGGEGLQGRSLREQVKTFLATGYESSSLALTWAFLLLAQHPDIESLLAAELKTALGDRTPTPSDLPDLPYTQAVVQETLRLYPPLWMTGRQPVHSCEIGGVPVTPQTLVMTSPWAVQRLPQFFPCPDAFRPERWLTGETDNLPRYAYFPFGGGPRICIGHRFALLETVLLLASIAQRFRLERIPGPPIQPWATMTLRPSQAVRVQLRTRA